MKRKKRKGRVGRPRKTNGHTPRYDYGTPELAHKRAMATSGGDPSLATTALDRLFARGILTGQERQAGFRYLILRQQVFGKAGAKIGGYSDLIGGFQENLYTRSPEEEEEIHTEFILADEALRSAGTPAYHAVRAIVLEDIDHCSEAAKSGLKTLADFWGF